MCDICVIKNCGECPFFVSFLEEYEPLVGMVEKGRCHKWNKDEIWATKVPCSYVESMTKRELAAAADTFFRV